MDIGDVRLPSKGSLDGTAQAVHATEFERVISHGNMRVIGCCHSVGIHVDKGGYLLLSTLRTLSFPRAKSSTRSL